MRRRSFLGAMASLLVTRARSPLDLGIVFNGQHLAEALPPPRNHIVMVVGVNRWQFHDDELRELGESTHQQFLNVFHPLSV